MSAYFKVCNIAYWLGLTIWVSALIAAGVAAMNVFGALGPMEMSVARFAAAPAETQGMLAAGIAMERVFFTVDMLQFAAAPLTLLALALQFAAFGMRVKRAANIVRSVCILIASLMLAYYALNIAPGMNRQLRQYWEAAEAGEMGRAQDHRARFNQDHAAAEGILRSNLILLMIAVGASAAAFTSWSPKPRAPLDQPQLARARQ